MRIKIFALVCFLLFTRGFVTAGGESRDWPVYLGDKENSHYSPLKQINTRNVHRLEVAWTYHSGDLQPDKRTQIQCNPLIVGGVLYGISPRLELLALDAVSGKELWRFDPSKNGGEGSGVNRGVVYWADGDDRRIHYTAGQYLFAINAGNGQLVSAFGDQGRVDLKQGLGRDTTKLRVVATTPGVVYRDLLVLPSTVGEGPGQSAPGHIRAYNVRTGKMAWIFHTIPHPGEFGYETWPDDSWKHIGGANCWAGMAMDEERGIVFVPTGSAAYDFWGGNRIGQNLFANCLLALDATTGKRLWHFQFVHHDIWDRDPPAPPTLVRLKRDGKSIDAVAQTTKSGHVFVFNRETGESLFPIEERAVPMSDVPGEYAWPTQPFPLKPAPFSRQLFTADEITDISPESHRTILEQFVKFRPHTPFMPPSREGTIIFPGFDGGAEWGGAAVDPRKGILYVNGRDIPCTLTMADAKSKGGVPLSSGERIYSQICAACHGLNRAGNAERGFPSLEKVAQKLKKPDIVQLLARVAG